MRNLILYRDDNFEFDRVAVATIARATKGASGVSEDGSDVCTLKFHFYFNSDDAIVRLSKDCKTIQIVGTGIASQWIAWVMQEKINQPLHMTDTDYSFDIKLWTYKLFDDVRNIVEGKQ